MFAQWTGSVVSHSALMPAGLYSEPMESCMCKIMLQSASRIKSLLLSIWMYGSHPYLTLKSLKTWVVLEGSKCSCAALAEHDCSEYDSPLGLSREAAAAMKA